MNWELFSSVLALGLATALLNLRRQLSPVEAWALVLSRTTAAGLLAWLLPETATTPAVLALAVWEVAQLVAGAVIYAARWYTGKREGRQWLLRWKRLETELETAQKTPGGTSGS